MPGNELQPSIIGKRIDGPNPVLSRGHGRPLPRACGPAQRAPAPRTLHLSMISVGPIVTSSFFQASQQPGQAQENRDRDDEERYSSVSVKRAVRDEAGVDIISQ